MSISHATAHRLHRSPETDAELSLRTGELTCNDDSTALLERLKSGFLARLSREHGSFASDAATAPLQQALETFLDGGDSFSEATTRLMERFKQAVEENSASLAADFLFFEEQSAGNHVFYLFVAQRKESLAIGDDLEVTRTWSLDTGPTLFGIKVDLAEWRSRKQYAYLTLLPPRGNPALAEAFLAATGFSHGLDKAEATLAFLEGVEAFSQRMPEEQVNDFRRQVVDYCLDQDGRDQPVDYRELARSLEGVDADEFAGVLASHAPAPNEQAMLDRRSLQRYVKFAGREKDLAISFSSFQLHHRIHYDADSDTLSISRIPKALRSQLLAHLQQD